MAGPTLILNTTQFGHADLVDELEAGANEVDDDDDHDDNDDNDANDANDDHDDDDCIVIIISVPQVIKFCKADPDSNKYPYRFHQDSKPKLTVFNHFGEINIVILWYYPAYSHQSDCHQVVI